MELRDLQRKFNRLITEAEAIRQQYAGKPETMTAEEEERWTKLLDEAERVQKQIDNLEREQKLRSWSREPVSQLPVAGSQAALEAKSDDTVAVKAFVKWLVGGSLTEVEMKALATDPATAGGFLIAPQQFVAQLLKRVDDNVVIRQLATVIRLDRAQSLGVPVLETDLSDAEWTSELATGSEDTALSFGKRQLFPHPLAKRVKISQQLLRQATINPEELVQERLAQAFAIAEEKAYLTGDGQNRPLGVFVASDQGIDTSRDVTAANSGAIAADDLIEVRHTLKEAYARNARWILHRDVLKRIRKLKDASNQYLWAPGLAGAQPATILDIPYIVSEFAPNEIAAGRYVAILGDFRYYWIADALDMQVQRLVELYAEANQVGFIARREVDGMPVLAEAFVRYKL